MGRYIGGLDRDGARRTTSARSEVLRELRPANGHRQRRRRRRRGAARSRRSTRSLRERPDIDAAMFDGLLGVLAEYRRAHP